MKNPFEYQRPDEDQIAAIERVRLGCKELAQTILDSVPPGRYQSLAMTELERVAMWGSKGIVFEEK